MTTYWWKRNQANLIPGTGISFDVQESIGSDTIQLEISAPSAAGASVNFGHEGDIIVGAGQSRWYNDTGRTLTLATFRCSLETAPIGAAAIFDLNKDGTTVFTNQAHRLSIADGDNTASTTTFDVPTIANGSYFTVDVDQIGSGTAGGNLSVQIWLDN